MEFQNAMFLAVLKPLPWLKSIPSNSIVEPIVDSLFHLKYYEGATIVPLNLQ